MPAIDDQGQVSGVTQFASGFEGGVDIERAPNGDLVYVSFGTDGTAMTSFGPTIDFARSVALQPDGKVVAAGYTSNGTDNDIAVIERVDGVVEVVDELQVRLLG